ncbi:hypothetical protein NOF55_11980 [Rhizobiaceae bacterium BDR2-2]|uniref:Lipoprotein n=1 Tax=Ectorhizobium quercum TaxID=2965071 RepID=A0AAE3SV05_9HYPH|nr:hypothetical protein [Ectorhizobium quercum]MCX8997820.1 hypothetical protein [Ectorhizobium quercum]
MRLDRTSFILSAAAIAAAALLLSGCQSKRPSPQPAAGRAALPTMERVALGANACWFKSGDAAFRPYKLAPELNSFSGRPRILVVPARSPEARPLLVVEAEGNPARVSTYGPLMNEASAGRITADVNRWAGGARGC